MNERRSLQLLAEKYEQVLEFKGQGYRVSDDIRNQIISIYKQGSTDLAEIARGFNLSRRTIHDILKQGGVVLPGRGYGQIQRGRLHGQRTGQKIPPDQIKYINNLISQRDDQGIFQYSEDVIAKMVNDHIDGHPELNWYKIVHHRVQRYIIKWEEENIPGETRLDYGIKRSNGGIYRRGTNLPDNAGTRQIKAGPLGPYDPSHITAGARAQKINDQEFLPQVVNGYTSGL